MRKLQGSLLSILVTVFLMVGFMMFYNMFLSNYLIDRVYPVDMDEVQWKSAFNTTFYWCIATIGALQFVWYMVSLISDPEPLLMRKKWNIFFILAVLAGILIPTLFIAFYPIESILFSVIIFLYFSATIIVTFILSTLYNYPEIRYCSGVWKLAGR